MRRLFFMVGLTVFMWLVPVSAWAADGGSVAAQSATDTGVSGLWILANISYAGMRAQNSSSSGWRIIAFIFGFPGTLISFFAVEEGRERAYGIEVPRARS
ncbi:MAG TPA: hypothetical protein VI488_06770 [Candidatus Angelobacter sp.]